MKREYTGRDGSVHSYSVDGERTPPADHSGEPRPAEPSQLGSDEGDLVADRRGATALDGTRRAEAAAAVGGQDADRCR